MYQMYASYLDAAFGDAGKLVANAKQTLTDVDFDTMVCTGLSGTLVVPWLARELGKYFAVVRKGESNHSGFTIEGTIGDRWIFVDDFISTGKTRERVTQEIDTCSKSNYAPFVTKYVGTYQYARNDANGPGEFLPALPPVVVPEVPKVKTMGPAVTQWPDSGKTQMQVPFPKATKLAINSQYGTQQCDCIECRRYAKRVAADLCDCDMCVERRQDARDAI